MPMIGLTPWALAFFQNSYAPKVLPWSVIARAGMPMRAASENRSSSRAAPASMENSVWVWRWTNESSDTRETSPGNGYLWHPGPGRPSSGTRSRGRRTAVTLPLGSDSLGAHSRGHGVPAAHRAATACRRAGDRVSTPGGVDEGGRTIAPRHRGEAPPEPHPLGDAGGPE